MNPKEEKPIRANADIWQEQFISSHIFLYVEKGILRFFDGDKTVTFKSGEYFIARKNRLARYIKERCMDEFNYVAFFYEDDFLKSFQDKYAIQVKDFYATDTFVKIKEIEAIPYFIRSLRFYNSLSKLSDVFRHVKYEELLAILLQNQPEFAGLFKKV